MKERNLEQGVWGSSEATLAERFTPALSLRPHHFWLPDIRAAMLGIENPYQLATSRAKRIKESNFERGYQADILGEQTERELQAYTDEIESYFAKLANLPDNSFIQLDITPDGLCGACVIGRHCTSTNYTSNYTPHGTAHAEAMELDRITKRLKKLGYEPSVDYTTKPTAHLLQDLGGRTLDDPKSGNLKNVLLINSLIVRTGALRDIARREYIVIKPDQKKVALAVLSFAALSLATKIYLSSRTIRPDKI